MRKLQKWDIETPWFRNRKNNVKTHILNQRWKCKCNLKTLKTLISLHHFSTLTQSGKKEYINYSQVPSVHKGVN